MGNPGMAEWRLSMQRVQRKAVERNPKHGGMMDLLVCLTLRDAL
jgi:hypothetical protein